MDIKIPEIEARNILATYDGANNQLIEWKMKFINNKSFKLTRPQADYVLKYHQTVPKVAKKYINIVISFGERLQEEKYLPKPVEKIWCEKLLCESDKAYHIWGKFFDSEQNHAIWLPKGAVLQPEKKLNRIIDYSKYSHRPPKEWQPKAIEALLANDKFILADDMGTGKSTSAIIAALESGSKKILIVCPASVKINWKKEIRFYTDRPVLIVEGRKWGSTYDFYIINYDILKNYHTTDDKNENDDLKLITKENFDLAIVDECFTYNSKIMTEYGELYIGDIVENGIDVKILTFNYKTKKTEYKTIDRWIRKNKSIIYQIKLRNGVFIECTDNHKFYTNERGYIKAKDLTTNDNLYLLSETINKETNLEEKQILLKELCINNQQQINDQKSNRKEILQNVFKLRKNDVVYNQEENGKTKILFNKMRFLTFNEQRRCKREKTANNYKSWRLVKSNETNIQGQSPYEDIILRENEEKQSYVKSRNFRKNETEVNWKNIFVKRWTRKINRTSNIIMQNVRRGLGTRIANTNQRGKTSFQKFAERISGGYRKQRKENFNRNRWKNAHNEKMEVFRQKENRSVEFVRVESIKILEQGSYDAIRNVSSKNTRVYDLEVKDNHNYFINGILVSNCHYLSNSSSQRTKLMNDILEKIPKVWLLTGTPMTNRPINYYNLLKLVNSPVALNWQHYVKRYCRGFRFKANGRTIWNTSGHSNLDELRERTKNIVLRRLKTDIPGLPEKTISPIFLELQSTFYNEEIEEFMRITEDQKGRESLAITINRLMKVRQVIAYEKIPYTCELIDKCLELDKKVIVFTNFTMPLDMLHEKYPKNSVIYDGRMSAAKREEAKEKFQNDPKTKILIGNIIAAGIGINLTAAEVVIMNDLSFVPSHHSQAEDRAYRHGQQKDVLVYYPVFENTIEQIVYNILQSKKDVIDQAMGDGEYSENFAKELIKELF